MKYLLPDEPSNIGEEKTAAAYHSWKLAYDNRKDLYEANPVVREIEVLTSQFFSANQSYVGHRLGPDHYLFHTIPLAVAVQVLVRELTKKS